MIELTMNEHSVRFDFWDEDRSEPLASPVAIDFETTLIDTNRPWLTPALVAGGATDGKQGYIFGRDTVASFLAAHGSADLVFHNAPFDLAVIDCCVPEADIYDAVENDRVFDTQIQHQLLTLATEGHVAFGKGKSTLDTCVLQYLGLTLPKEVEDQDGRDIRTSWGKFLGGGLSAIPDEYWKYLAKDVLATWLVDRELSLRTDEELDQADGVWGFADWRWLDEQYQRWGPLTHHIQLRAAIVLDRITANGLTIDISQRDKLRVDIERLQQDALETLREYGFLPGGKGSSKALQHILAQLQRDDPRIDLQHTATGKFATSKDALAEHRGHEFFDALHTYNFARSLLNNHLSKMVRPRLYPRFRPLVNSGRTSSYGEINAQNLPKKDRIRSCFIASAGHVLISADYSAIELATLSQAIETQFCCTSNMGVMINEGRDLHCLLASRVYHKSESDVTKAERQMVKAINFGVPGGMGKQTLQKILQIEQGHTIELAEVEELFSAFRETFPEMVPFLNDEIDVGFVVSEICQLTPQSYFDYCGDNWLMRRFDGSEREHKARSILGWMMLKVLRDDQPETQAGRPYSVDEVRYFWSQFDAALSRTDNDWHLSETTQNDLRRRRPSFRLRKEVLRLAGRSSVITRTGRIRAKASFSARRNNIFQGLAADGAKLALWRLWREGYRIVNFIHDEVLVEVPENADLTHEAERIQRIMIESMQLVVPDIRVDVEYAASRRWYASAERTTDEYGNLTLYEPAVAQDAAANQATN